MKLSARLLAGVLVLMAVGHHPLSGQEQGGGPVFNVELEAGPVWQSYNDAQIPNSAAGTRFSLVDAVGHGPGAAARVYLSWRLNARHSLRMMLAPLTLKGGGILGAPVDFAGRSFDPDDPVDAVYKFNSYRLGYQFRLWQGTRWNWRIGGTVKIRDAKIELRQAGITGRKTDFGLVPLLHISGGYRLHSRWQLLLDIEALAGGPGRAEDAALKLSWDAGERWSLAGGYRMVEGGADVDDVYTFAWLHYAVASVSWRF